MKKIVTKLNEKGLNNLAAFLRNSGKDEMAQRVEDRDSRAISAWNDEATQNASIHNGKLIDCGVEVGTWSTGVYTYSFDLSEVDTQGGIIG